MPHSNVLANCKAYPGAYCCRDHVPVIATIRVETTKVFETFEKKRVYQFDSAALLQNALLQQRYRVAVENNFVILSEQKHDEIDCYWQIFH